MDLDAATYKNFQFTEIKGPMWVDNHSILLGVAADTRAGNPDAPSRQRARFSVAGVQADCQVLLGTAPQYNLRATLTDGDLAQFAKENVSGRQTPERKGRGQRRPAEAARAIATR